MASLTIGGGPGSLLRNGSLRLPLFDTRGSTSYGVVHLLTLGWLTDENILGAVVGIAR